VSRVSRNLYLLSIIGAGAVAAFHLLRLIERLSATSEGVDAGDTWTYYFGFVMILLPYSLFIVGRSVFRGELGHTVRIFFMTLLYWMFLFLHPSVWADVTVIVTSVVALVLGVYQIKWKFRLKCPPFSAAMCPPDSAVK